MVKLDLTPKGVITNENGQLRSCVGEAATHAFFLRTLIVALNLEKDTGLKLARGPSALARAKQITGLKTRDRAKHITRLEVMLEEKLSQCLVVEAGEV